MFRAYVLSVGKQIYGLVDFLLPFSLELMVRPVTKRCNIGKTKIE